MRMEGRVSLVKEVVLESSKSRRLVIPFTKWGNFFPILGLDRWSVTKLEE